MQSKAPTATAGNVHAKLANGKSFFIAWVGKVSQKGETVMQLAETRPGVAGCVKTFTFKRD